MRLSCDTEEGGQESLTMTSPDGSSCMLEYCDALGQISSCREK